MIRLSESCDALSPSAMIKKRPSVLKLARRGLFSGLLAGSLAALAFSGMAEAQNIAGFDSNQPVSVDAARIELQDRQDRVVFSGNVVIRQGDLQMTAQRTTLAYTDADGVEIHRIDASGNVTVRRGRERATGAAAVYDFNRKVIVLSGGVELRRGEDVLTGGRVVIDLNSGLSSIDGNSAGNPNDSGRVSGSFTVPDQ